MYFRIVNKLRKIYWRHSRGYDFDIVHLVPGKENIVQNIVIDACCYIQALFSVCKHAYCSSPTKDSKIRIKYNGINEGQL